jgi:[ribosomal protein S5]-alanine N-acetyltransferase
MPRMPAPRRRGTPATRPGVPIDTPRFYLRALQPTDASERWLSWARDPEVMDPLNSPEREMTILGLQRYIARHDQVTHLMLGIFDRKNDRHIGFFEIDIDERHKLASFNVVIGDKAYWGQRVVLETRAALLDYVFRKRGIEKAIGMPLARNFPAIFNYRAQGWRLEGVFKAHRESCKGDGRLDQLQFGLTREEWRNRRVAEGDRR